MRNRLIAAILGLFGTLTGVQAAPDVTSEITYDLASGRADYYFWKDEASAGNNGPHSNGVPTVFIEVPYT